MMRELKIGVIGTGRIGAEHIRRIQRHLSGAGVAAVASSSPKRAEKAAELYGIPEVMTAEELIRDPGIDAVLIAAPGSVHEQYLLACLECEKPVFCEKPLADTGESSRIILEAEADAGRRLIQLGFMRRFDRHHRELRDLVCSGSMGHPLMVHAVHRNPQAGEDFDDRMEIMDAAIHEIDVVPWLLGGDPLAACRVLHGRTASCAEGKLYDPQLVILETVSGVLIDLEVLTHCDYGYDISCEVVCEQGTVSLPASVSNIVRQGSYRRVREYDFWKERYQAAFDMELQRFIDGARAGTLEGPTAWDGYMAAAAGEACLLAQKSGKRQEICYMEQPALYQDAEGFGR